MDRKTEAGQNYGAESDTDNVRQFPHKRSHEESLSYLPQKNLKAGEKMLKNLRKRNKAMTITALDKVRNFLGNKSRRVQHREKLDGKINDLWPKVKTARFTAQEEGKRTIDIDNSEESERLDKAA